MGIGITGTTVLALALGGWIGQSQDRSSPRQDPQRDQTITDSGNYDAPSVSSEVASFMEQVSEGNAAEIKLAKMAQDRSERDEIKMLGKRIERDHVNTREQLEALARLKNVDIDDDPNDDQQQVIDQLKELKGDAFDRAYLDHMVEDHQKDIDAFKKHENESDPEVAVFVKSTLPVLQYHLERVQDAQKRLGK